MSQSAIDSEPGQDSMNRLCPASLTGLHADCCGQHHPSWAAVRTWQRGTLPTHYQLSATTRSSSEQMSSCCWRFNQRRDWPQPPPPGRAHTLTVREAFVWAEPRASYCLKYSYHDFSFTLAPVHLNQAPPEEKLEEEECWGAGACRELNKGRKEDIFFGVQFQSTCVFMFTAHPSHPPPHSLFLPLNEH